MEKTVMKYVGKMLTGTEALEKLRERAAQETKYDQLFMTAFNKADLASDLKYQCSRIIKVRADALFSYTQKSEQYTGKVTGRYSSYDDFLRFHARNRDGKGNRGLRLGMVRLHNRRRLRQKEKTVAI